MHIKLASLWREGVANARIANAANIKEGPRSCVGQHHLQDQECCQAPHVRGACSALVIGEGQVSTEEEKISAWRG